MKTVEFKLSLNQSQQAKVNDWLNVQRWVWNQGLQLLEEFDAFTAWDKESKAWVPCCPRPRPIVSQEGTGYVCNGATEGTGLRPGNKRLGSPCGR